MNRVLSLALVFLALVVVPSRVEALNITQTFCAANSDVGEHDSCPTGLTATLNITDTNEAERQYLVTLTLDTTDPDFDAAAYTSIQQVQFDISGINGDNTAPWGDYQSVPTLDATGVDGGFTWSVFFDQVNNGSGCSSNQNNSQHVCASVGTTLGGTDTGDIDVWKFYIDLDNSLAALTSSIDLNLRAVFRGPGNTNGTILSPDFTNIPDTGPGTGGPGGANPAGDTAVPEPASLVLLGSGLALAAGRFRRRQR
jgi:hypothetical protein